jgi:alkyl sulfatase BDS1-like metallo-beta-lactamase superfamily hydrolase
VKPSSKPTLRRVVLVVLVVGAGLALRRPLYIAFAGSGRDPSIPSELRVSPSIDPELAEHSKIFEEKVYRVGERVYSWVGGGLANVIFVEGETGVIVVDTGESVEQGRAAMAELRKITPKPIAAVVLTHHHADHVLGTSAFVSAEEASAGTVPIFAHETLVRRFVDETGYTMELQAARSMHMYGAVLGPADRASSNAGIGPFLDRGQPGFLSPTRVFADALDVTVAGVRMQMRYVPSEAESEIAVYLPDLHVLLSAEVIQDHTFPNLYTIRGARYRDPVTWVKSIDLLRTFEAEAMVLQHGPPVEGKAEVARVLTHYRDEIQYVHDQAVRRMNQGLPPDELARAVALPPHLRDEKPWGREYYGTVKHSVRNIYGGYEGWFAGDPVALDPTPSAEYAGRTVRMMGGRERVLGEARRSYEARDWQFAAELSTLLVRIDTKDMEARHLKAAAFRQQGYAQRNASWRNYYLVSAMELDEQIPSALYLRGAKKRLGPALSGLPAESQVALLPVRLKAEETLEVDLVVGLHFRDVNEDYALHLRRGVLEVARRRALQPGFALDVTRASFGALLGGATLGETLGATSGADGTRLSGDTELGRRFFGWFEVPFTQKPEVVVR